jgi:hypothetical protein
MKDRPTSIILLDRLLLKARMTAQGRTATIGKRTARSQMRTREYSQPWQFVAASI